MSVPAPTSGDVRPSAYGRAVWLIGSWASDASDLIRALAVLAWPVMVGLIVWWLRGELPALTRRLRRLSVPGAEAELDPEVRQLEEVAEQVESEVGPQLPGGPIGERGSAVDDVVRLAAQDPRLAVIKLVTAIEVRVRDIASTAGHENPHGAPWHHIAEWLVHHGTLPRGVASAADLLRPIRNRVVHGQDRDVDDRDVAVAIDAGLRLLRVLEAIPNYAYEVRAMVPIYMHDAATQEHPEGRGVVLWEFDARGNQRAYRIYPTRNTYEPGQRVGWQWSFDRTWGETFWRDPWDENRVKLAWSESAEFVGQPLIQQPD